MFDIEVIRKCPVARATFGEIVFKPEAIAQIVGLLAGEGNQEWAAFGWGRVEKEGRSIVVERLTFPAQDRSSGEVVIEEHNQTPELVLVLHSHHGMGAFFSSTDLNELNPLYRSSVVVAKLGSRSQVPPLEWMPVQWAALGFEYKAVMRVQLPCGSVGEIAAAIRVDSELGELLHAGLGVEPEWPKTWDGDVSTGDCPHVERSDYTSFYDAVRPKCGLDCAPPQVVQKEAIFGSDASRADELHRATRQGSGRSGRGDKGPPDWANDLVEFMRDQVRALPRRPEVRTGQKSVTEKVRDFRTAVGDMLHNNLILRGQKVWSTDLDGDPGSLMDTSVLMFLIDMAQYTNYLLPALALRSLLPEAEWNKVLAENIDILIEELDELKFSIEETLYADR